jgi:hypothetical protein
MDPSLTIGPPTLSAVPSIAASALNMLPIAPSLGKALVPVPWTLWPAGSWSSCKFGF